MKNQWLAYLVVAGISVLAGVAIAGRPTSGGKAATITLPTTVVTTTTTASPPATDAVPADTEPATTDAPPDTEAPASTTSTTTLPPSPPAADVVVVAVNGAGTSGLAGRTRDELVFFGFTQTRVTDATQLVDETFVYYVEGFEAAASDVAGILGLGVDRIRPIAEVPDYGAEPGDQVVVYAGRDRT